MTTAAETILRFHWSPDAGTEDCICSSCRKPIPETNIVRMFQTGEEPKFEMRFHIECYFKVRKNLHERKFEWGDTK